MELLTHHVLAAARALSVLSLALETRDQFLATRTRAELAAELSAIADALALVPPGERDAAQRLADSIEVRARAIA
ncbi:MAG: hypothetical protein KF773_31130 [Deltaproteobacteria bacterium]|nr:hypothetical protein [Deltaproteobacteria bacterium]MCW5806217.1 hypothetical protein [Deltaproteobacteria bacterium]